jgi:hypothetical protein
MFLGQIKRAVRSGRLVPMTAVMAVALATPAAADMRADPLLAVLGPSSVRLMGAARIAAIFGTVTSGFRSAEHNRQVGGVPNSFHLLGRALDVQRRRGVTHQMIDSALRRAGFVLVESLDERDHSHFAFASALPFSAVATSTTTVVPVSEPSKPLPPRVRADDHGVLLAANPSLLIAEQPPIR